MASKAEDRKEQRLDTTVFSANRSSISLGQQLRLFRNRGGAWVDLTNTVTACDWTDRAGPDASPVVEGTLTAVVPPGYELGGKAFLRDGDRVRLDTFWAGRWREVWTARAYDPEFDSSGSVSCKLYDDLFLLQATKTDRDFVKSKARKKGWKAHEIVAELSRRYRFPVSSVVKGERDLSLRAPSNATLLDIIRLAYKRESEHTGRDYFLSWRRNGLAVLPVSVKNVPWHFEAHVRSVSLATERSSAFCTALLMRCTIKENGKKVKVKMRVMNEAAITRYGYIERSKRAKSPDTRAELKRMGQHLLARRMIPERKLSFDHAGVAMVRAGDVARITVPSLGLRQTKPTKLLPDQGLVVLEEIQHSVGAGSYSMSVTARFDPFASRADIVHGDHEKRAKKRKKREKKK